MPDFLVMDIMRQAHGVGPARAGIMRGGLVFEQIGTDILLGGYDPTLQIGNSPTNLLVRFFGQVWAATVNAGNTVSIRPYDEGGTNDFHVVPGDVTAKGAVGVSYASGGPAYVTCPHFVEVLTADRPYLVAVWSAPTGDRAFARWNPDTNTWGTFSDLVPWGAPTMSVNTIAHDGLVFACQNDGGLNTTPLSSFDPVSGGIVNYSGFSFTAPGSGTNHRRNKFFTLHDRLFLVASGGVGVAGENSAVARVLEFSFGGWSDANGGSPVNTFLDETAIGGQHCVFRISQTKVLVIGHGGSNDPNGGLLAISLSTVGDAPGGNLQISPSVITTTNAVIPLALRPSTGSYGGGGVAERSSRVYAMTVTDDAIGTIRHFMYYFGDAALIGPQVATMFEVFDDATPMVLINQTPQCDSTFAFPENFYGGGAGHDGIDGSTRFVSAQARGWTGGNVGLRLKASVHGDAMILSYHNLAGGPFTVGEIIQGAGGGEGTLIGDGAAEGLFLRSTNGTPFVGDEQITGLTSGATADLDLVLAYDVIVGSLFQVGETVTGQTSGATGTIKRLGLGGPGEEVFKVEWTNSPTAFVNAEQILGGTSAATANLTAAPAGSHGGDADKKIRIRFYAPLAAEGKGVPTTLGTMVLGTGVGCLVSKGTGPGGSDEAINIVADGAVGDTPISFEWDYLADGVPSSIASQIIFECERT